MSEPVCAATENKLPDPQWRVLAVVIDAVGRFGPVWCEWLPGCGRWETPGGIRLETCQLTFIDHPRNDAEAVEIIEEAKKAKQ